MAGEEFLVAGMDEVDGFASLARQQRRDHRSIVVAGFAAKAAADIGLNYCEEAVRAALERGTRPAQHQDHLGHGRAQLSDSTDE